MIENDDQLATAQKLIANLQKILLTARKVHTPHEYQLLSEPLLLELQQREHEVLEYLSRSDATVL